MNAKWNGLLLGLGLVLVANIGAFWFGRSFKLEFAILVVSVFFVLWIFVRHRKTQLVRDLTNADRETQDRVLAGLDENDRKEILRRLGRDA
jgi:hypothetical protein